MISLTGGTQALEEDLVQYFAAWKNFKIEQGLSENVFQAVPTTISWKVADKMTLFANLCQLGEAVEQTHIGTVNGRFIASSVLHTPHEGMKLLKIMERRANSLDRLGLDGLDFYVRDMKQILSVLQKAGLPVEADHNDMHRWLSLRFGTNGQYEAKFVDHLVLRVAIDEMEITQTNLLTEIAKLTA